MSSTGAADHDVIVVGGGHNGLIAAGFLAKAGLRVHVLEARASFGGLCGSYEFMPGYKTAITNSPGSLEFKFIRELKLEKYGLRFLRTDPTVLHAFPGGAFVGWRDRERIAAQLDSYAAGEAKRYFGLIADLENLARHLKVSVFEPSPQIAELASQVPAELADLFERVFFGSLRQLLDERLRSDQAKALLGMLALNASLVPPSAPGSAIGLMLRPISLASNPPTDPNDPRSVPLRGSTGLPVGGMGAIIDALVASVRAHGGTVEANAPVLRLLRQDGRISGVTLKDGRTLHAQAVLTAINPKTVFCDLLDAEAAETDLVEEMQALPMRGSAFKLVLALDGLPSYRGLPSDLTARDAAQVQFRVAPSLDYIEKAVSEGLAGQLAQSPIMWGLIVSESSPALAPKGRKLLSVNAWHAPYTLSEGQWPEQGDVFADRCVKALSDFLPDIADRIVARSYLNPRQLEAEFGLIGSNITHGEMMPGALFGARPSRRTNDYRSTVPGLYLSGAGTWPGGYVTGLPGFNAANVVINDFNKSR
ncbi:MAG: NAD(P)/FAD-dependent oxidoreductase [Pararhodobacter sp.]|nr:NAD(P)/FAD-dependent oxidoreductase [Pararhodobacter sp.]